MLVKASAESSDAAKRVPSALPLVLSRLQTDGDEEDSAPARPHFTRLQTDGDQEGERRLHPVQHAT